MKLHLLLVALLPQARCAQHAMDAAELESALQTPALDAWLERVAARHNLSKDAVRSNVRAMTYHLEPAGPEPGSASGSAAGGAAGQTRRLERRQPLVVDYPNVFGDEELNDPMTQNRIMPYHEKCREIFAQPAGGPYIPNHGVRSFWRAIRGGCREYSVRIFCRLPPEFGPPNWEYNARRNLRETSFSCTEEQECTTFEARNFPRSGRIVHYGGCTTLEKLDRPAIVNQVPGFFQVYKCPMAPATTREWDGYGVSGDGRPIVWTLFTGYPYAQLVKSRSADFMFGRTVKWQGKDPDYQPWLKFGREREKATIHLYSHVGFIH